MERSSKVRRYNAPSQRMPFGTVSSTARANARTRLRGYSRAVAPAAQVRQAVRAYQSMKRDAGYVDLAFAGYPVNTTGNVTLIATIAQGASVNQRIGKKAVYKSVQVRGFLYAGTTATLNDTTILLVLDRKPTNALPAVTDILVSAASQSFNNDVNSDRFRILRRWDKTLIGNSTTPATGAEAANVDEFVSLKGLPVEFGAAGTGAIGDISKNALYLVTVGNVAAGTAAAVANLGFRTRFTEI